MRRVELVHENIVHSFYITDDMVHFSCSHASWREDIVPDLSPSAYKSTQSVTEFLFLKPHPQAMASISI
jgi:hypothetical protein